MTSFSLAVQTAYQDLLQLKKLQAVQNLGGTPYLKEQKDHGRYWYAQQRIGRRVLDRYLGPDTEELRKEIELARTEIEDRKAVEKRCSNLVRQLRAAGAPALDRETGKVLNAMAQAGTFRLGGTLVGTHAFRLYGAELGVPLGGTLAATQDIDIAAFEGLKLVIEDSVTPSLPETFKALRFSPAPNLDKRAHPTRWILEGGGSMVDFLVPRMKDDHEVIKLEPLGVYAQALSFLNFLIADPIPAVGLYRSGVLVQIPRPERYAIHKLIVAQRRDKGSLAKARKDLAQAEFLIEVLSEDRPGDLQDAFQEAMIKGPKWRREIEKSLKQKPALSEILRALD
ncbi:MAG: hypothetical protein EP340_04680 [Alphaproteobacteria bacterium]|nr:MAG: hypothetical protein EP340_04680 [Alphaproteobacteria bacterium]